MLVITGSHGFVGSHLVAHLKAKHISFRSLSRRQINTQDTSLSPTDVVIHIAGRIIGIWPHQFYADNCELTLALIRSAQLAKVKKFIFISSARVSHHYPDPYTTSKKKAEAIIKNSGLPYVILRPSLIYGPGDTKNINLLIRLIKWSPLIAIPNISIYRQPLYIDDLIYVIIQATKDRYSNLTTAIIGPRKWAVADMVTAITFHLKINKPRITLPLKFIRNEIFKQTNWQKMFQIKATPFLSGIKKTLMH